MHDFMKTIISAIKTWTAGKIKDSAADWNQNDSGADNYVKNRTHYDSRATESFSCTFNGDATGLEQVAINADVYLVKVLSDNLPSIDNFVNSSITMYTPDGYQQATIADEDILPRDENGVIYSLANASYICYDTLTLDGITLTKGIWFFYTPNIAWVSELSYVKNIGELKKLDLKYLPDYIDKQVDWLDTDVESMTHILNKPSIWNDENGDVYIGKDFGNTETASPALTEKSFYDPKRCVILKDEVDGYDYVVSVRNGNVVSYCTTSSIRVTTMPNIDTYLIGDNFIPSGMVVTATGVDGSTREVVNYTYDTITEENLNNFVITYTEGNNVFTTSISLNLHDFSLIDFNYTANEDGTYTLTSWKGTYNGEPSTKIIVPNSELIIV